MEVIPLLKIDGGVLPLPSNLGKAEPAKPDYYSKELAACFLFMHLLGSSLFTWLSCTFPTSSSVPQTFSILHVAKLPELLPMPAAHEALLRTAGQTFPVFTGKWLKSRKKFLYK